MTASIFAARPNKCTGTIALVLGNCSFNSVNRDIHIVQINIYQNRVLIATGQLPTVAANVKSAVITHHRVLNPNPSYNL
jgi:hypothetical protein